MAKRIRDEIKNSILWGFQQVEKNIYFKKILNLHFAIRGIIFVVLVAWSLLAMLTPIPAGWITMIFAFAILFGTKPVKRIFIRTIYFLRIPLLWRRYKEWKNTKRKR